ncbi:MAG: aminotransferase class III, partial [Thermodesulfobacteriota bacterium]
PGSCVAGIGANGNICSTYCQIMADEVGKLILIGRPGREDKLKEVACEIYAHAYKEIQKYRAYLKGQEVDYIHSTDKLTGIALRIHATNAVKTLLDSEQPPENPGKWIFDQLREELQGDLPIYTSTDYSDLCHANIIISASNSPHSIIFPQMLGDGPVLINDIAVPFDVDDSVKDNCPNVRVINGGIVKLPYNPDLQIQGMPLDPGYVYPCMAEAILLGMEGSREHYSYGKITKPMVSKILQIAKIHGFKLGQFKVGRSF